MMAPNNYLTDARRYWQEADASGSRVAAQLTIGAALIAIAEELRAMNERADTETWFTAAEQEAERENLGGPIQEGISIEEIDRRDELPY